MKKNEIKLDDTGERMIPEAHKGTVMYAEHMTRYIAAQDFVKGKVVLDIASGSGYGTKILSKEAAKVYGVDVDKKSIEYSKNNFYSDNIEYLVGDGESIPLKSKTVDVVISFETIEHIEDYEKFLSEVKRVMKDDGVAIISTPNKVEFTQGNHFHLHEFEYDELEKLLKKSFKIVESYLQATWVSVALAKEGAIKTEGVVDGIKTYNMKPLDKDKALYFYFVCSNGGITKEITPINAFGGHYSARELVDIQKHNDKNIEDYKTVLNNANTANNTLNVSLDKAEKENTNLKLQLNEMTEEINKIKNHIIYKFLRKVKNIFSKQK